MTKSARLIASLRVAEYGFDAAMAAMNYKAANQWWDIIERESGELRQALREEDPCTTMADVRFFEGFKYVE